MTVTGDLSYNDTNCSQDGQVFMPPNEIAAKVGFCYEGDNHIPELTVEESLGFISALRFVRNDSALDLLWCANIACDTTASQTTLALKARPPKRSTPKRARSCQWSSCSKLCETWAFTTSQRLSWVTTSFVVFLVGKRNA